MFHGNHCWLFKFFDNLQCCVGIVDIVVGQFFTVQLLGCSQCILCSEWFAVECRLLVWIFAVA
ncbi:hypothetical protein D3C74_433850 [compost metagenome]